MIWEVDPVAISFLSFSIHWYGILFLLAIFSGLQVMVMIYKNEKMPVEHLYDQLLNMLIGIMLGARLAECIFYHPDYYLNNPIKIFAIWEGGLASHGGAIGALVVVYLYTKKYKIDFIWLFDRFAISIAIFAFFVRMGNFVNSEILGKPTEMPWGVIFKKIDILPRHPVQLYEAIIFLMIFLILACIYYFSKNIHRGSLIGLFLSFTFVFRFLFEFLKERQASYSSELTLSIGQYLSIPFILIGFFLLIQNFRKHNVIINN